METSHLRVGDTVRLSKKGALLRGDGFEGQDLTVVGFKHMVVGRLTHGYRALPTPLRPGIYLNHNCVGIATKTGISRASHYWHSTLELADKEEAARRGPRPQQLPPTFLRELPDTPLWEGDIVAFNYGPSKSEETRVVTAVDHFGCTAHDDNLPDHVSAYILGEELTPGYIGPQPTRLVAASRLKLVSRGNVWRYYHGEELRFETLVEEVRFAILMGWFTLVERGPSLRRAEELMRTEGAQAYFTIGDEATPSWEVLSINFNGTRLGDRYREWLLEYGEEPIHIP